MVYNRPCAIFSSSNGATLRCLSQARYQHLPYLTRPLPSLSRDFRVTCLHFGLYADSRVVGNAKSYVIALAVALATEGCHFWALQCLEGLILDVEI